MESTEIRQSVHALLQEVAHYHLINTGAKTLGDVESQLETYYPIKNEENVTYATITSSNFIAFMGGGYDPQIPAVSMVTIQNKVTISAVTDSKIEITVKLDDGEITPVYDYKRLIDDAHRYLGTGRKLDIEKYDVAKTIREL